MCENRHTKLCGNFQCRTRLRRIQQEIALRALDQETAQTEIANGTFSLSRRPLAVIGIDGRQTVNAARMSHDDPCEIVVQGHDGLVRHAAFRIRDQLDQNADDTRTQMALADIPQ